MHKMSTAAKTKWAVAAVVALGLIGIAAPLALADGVGAPTSAAGGITAPSSPSRPGSAGSLSSPSGSLGGSSASDDSSHTLKLQPGTGKFEGGSNTNTPCVGSSGFGSSSAQPGHKC